MHATAAVGQQPPVGPPHRTRRADQHLLREAGAAARGFQPGEKWAYRNAAGFDILARVVEVASGRSGAPADAYQAPETIARMVFCMLALTPTLSPQQRAECMFPMADPGRLDWDFIPKPDRQGIPLYRLDRHQRTMAHSLIATGLSMQGYSQALQIMAMENMLREIEAPRFGLVSGDFRHSDHYYLACYGRPGFEDTWTWRLLGHHLSLSYTIINQRYICVTPCNMGSQPAQAGLLRPLAPDEDLAFDLMHSLSPEQRAAAVIHTIAPPDYATRQVPLIGKVEYPDHIDLGIPWYRIEDADREKLAFRKDDPAGLCAARLAGPQAASLMALIGSYVHRMPDEIADRQLARIEREGLDNVYFCWAGGGQPGTPHYYRIQTSQFLIEFDNAINEGNHIHSVWRDYRNDLGHDLLADHYERERRTGHHLATRLTSSVPDDGVPDE